MAGTLFSDVAINFFVNTKQAIDAIDNLTKKFTTGTGGMMSAIGGIVGYKGLKGYYEQLKSIVELSEKWNLPFEDLYRFTNLFSQFGGTAEEAVAVVNQLQQLSNDLGLHSSGAFKELSAIIGQNLQAKDYAKAIAAIRQEFNRLATDPNGRQAQQELLRMIGTDSPALLRMMKASNQEYEEAQKRASQMRTVTKEQADELVKYDKKLADIKQRWQGIAAVALEIFKYPVDAIDWITKKIEALPDAIIKIGAAIATVFSGLGLKAMASKLLTALGLGGGTSTATAGATGASTVVAGNTASAVATKAGASILGTGLAAIAGALYPTAAGDEQDKGPEYEKLLQNNSLQHNQYIERELYLMRQIANTNKKEPEWAGKQSTTNDNRTINFNIYGVQGAEDLMTQMESLVQNNIPPITYKVGN